MKLAFTLLFGCTLALGACRKKPAEARPGAAPLSSAMLAAHADALAKELRRAHQRLLEQKDLGCLNVLSEPADLELCHSAGTAVEAASVVTDTTPVAEAVHQLGQVSLALDRLGERVRFGAFGDMMHRRLEHDAGAPHAPDHERLKLEPSPLMKEAQTLNLLERQTLRGLGAFLQYGSPEARDAALAECKQLVDARPKFPALGFELRQASVIETDAQRKAALDALAEKIQPRRRETEEKR